MTPFLLVLLGLFLILIEFYLPGALIGIIGGIIIIVGIIFFVSTSSSLLYTSLFIFGTIGAIYLTIRLSLWLIVHSKRGGIYLRGDQAGYQAAEFDKNAIGKQGIVLTDLKPGGFILVGQEKHPAISVGGYIVKGTTVTVIGGQEQSLLVQLLKEQSP